MAGSYWIKWNTSKWLTDPAVSACSPATRGILKDLLDRIYELDDDGSISGNVQSLSRQGRCFPDELESALDELDEHDVCDITRDGDFITITSRHAKKYLERKHKDRERKSRERAENDDDDGQSLDTSRTNNGQTKENEGTSRARASKDSIPLNSEKEKKGKPKYVSKSPPSFSEVKGYFTEQGVSEEHAEEFVDHYQSQGWRLGSGNPMKDWQASVRQWVRRIPEFKARGSPGSLMTYHEARQDWEKRGKPGGTFPGDGYEQVPQEGKDKPLWRRAA